MDDEARMKLAELTGKINAINTESGNLMGTDRGNFSVIKALSRLAEVEYLLGLALANMATRPAA
jgi:hypothetical protein